MVSDSSLSAFIARNPDTRELKPIAAFGRRVSFLYPIAVWRRVSLIAKLLRYPFSGRL